MAPSFAPVVFPHAAGPRSAEALRDRRRVEGEDAGWEEKHALAQRYAAGGFDEQALQVLDGALGQGPPGPWAIKLRELRTSLEARRAQEVLLRVEARPRREYVGFGRDVEFDVRLRNVSQDVVTLVAPAAGASDSPTVVSLEIERRDRDIYATEMVRTWSQSLFLHAPGDPPLRLAPGATHDFPVRIPADDVGPAFSGLRTLRLSGLLRSARVQRNEAWRSVRLPVRAGRVVVLPDGFEQLVARPLESMGTAVETVAPVHLLLAAEFVPAARRTEAVAILAGALADGHPSLQRAALGGLSLLRARAVGELLAPFVRPLVEALERSPTRADVLMEGLSVVTDVRLAPDRRLWMDWWRREQPRGSTITAADGRPS